MKSTVKPFELRKTAGAIANINERVKILIQWLDSSPPITLGSDLDDIENFCLNIQSIHKSLASLESQFDAKKAPLCEIDAYYTLTRLLKQTIEFTEQIKKSGRGSRENTEKVTNYLKLIEDPLSKLENQGNPPNLSGYFPENQGQKQNKGRDFEIKPDKKIESKSLASKGDNSDIIKNSQSNLKVQQNSNSKAPTKEGENSDSMTVSESNTKERQTADLVIITALMVEKESVLRVLRNKGIEFENLDINGRSYHRFKIVSDQGNKPCNVALFCIHDMGNIRAALVTQNVIIRLRPKSIILTGIAGGIRKKNDEKFLGDVIVSEQIVYYEPEKQKPSKVEFRHNSFSADNVLLRAAKSLKPADWFTLIETERPDGKTGRINPAAYFGIVASGETLVADEAWTEKLQDYWSKIIGVEMEGAGVSLAATESGLRGMLLVKGISDWADETKNDDWQRYASEAAASFVIALIRDKTTIVMTEPGLPDSKA
ncbi:MAG: 5'-methylthioadenosine/S-adenosylhomocysteine nucleosidase [Cyanobacteria bacterium P01_G01_bin.54]